TGLSGTEQLWVLDTGLLHVKANASILPGLWGNTSDHQSNEFLITTYARAGSGTPIHFEIKNVGRAGSLMSSLPGSDIVFTNLPANGSIPLSLTVGTTFHLGTSPPASLDVLADAGAGRGVINGTTVGPKLNAFLTGHTGAVFAGQSRPITF